MADDVFAPWPSTPMPDNRATNGGQCTPKDLPYDAPVGPKGLGHSGPGLGGTNHGTSGGQQGSH